jgi:hypothetical protein
MIKEEFTTPSGEVIGLRGLSGYETLLSQKLHRRDPLALNIFMLSCAMDTTEDEATTWLKTKSAGDFMTVAEKVQELSGIGLGARKSGVHEVSDGSMEGVSLSPGEGSEDDGDSSSG